VPLVPTSMPRNLMFPSSWRCLNGQPGWDQEWPTAAILNVNGAPANRNRTTPGRAISAAIVRRAKIRREYT
jgi:hypothetical protein